MVDILERSQSSEETFTAVEDGDQEFGMDEYEDALGRACHVCVALDARSVTPTIRYVLR